VKRLGFLPRIESLRGIAALTVVGYHVHGQMPAIASSGWLDWFLYRLLGGAFNGIGAVVTFFVLSGFVLARSLDSNSEPFRFLSNRFFRLFPAAMLVVALLTLLHWQFGFFVGYEASFTPADVILNLLMIKSDINGVMWSMTVECAATPLILLSVWIFRRHGEKALWLLIAILFAPSSWGPYAHLLGGFTNLAPLYAFVVGVLIHCRGGLLRPFDHRPLTSAIIAIATFCFCGTRTQSALVLMLECISAATTIALIAYCPAMPLFKPLDARLARFYGRISYSFYLMHPLGIALTFRCRVPQALDALGVPISLSVVCATLAAILITTPAAYLSWRFIEVPAISFGKTLATRRKLQAVS